MINFPNAKVNLGLNIVGVRPNGYHDLETVFYPIELCDVLVAVFDGKSGGTKYTVDYAAKLHRKTLIVSPM